MARRRPDNALGFQLYPGLPPQIRLRALWVARGRERYRHIVASQRELPGGLRAHRGGLAQRPVWSSRVRGQPHGVGGSRLHGQAPSVLRRRVRYRRSVDARRRARGSHRSGERHGGGGPPPRSADQPPQSGDRHQPTGRRDVRGGHRAGNRPGRARGQRRGLLRPPSGRNGGPVGAHGQRSAHLSGYRRGARICRPRTRVASGAR